MIKLIDFSVKQKEKTILTKVNVEFKSKVTIITGENGVGKSTLFNCIYGLKDYDGIIEINGTEYTKLNKDRNSKSCINYMVQENNLFNKLTILENIKLLNPGVEEREIFELAEELSLSKKSLNTKLKSCSGGEKQKTIFINAVLRKPSYILLDEPENNVDKETLITMFSMLKGINCNILLISHSLKQVIYDIYEEEQIETYVIHNQKLICDHESHIVATVPKGGSSELLVSPVNKKIISKLTNKLLIGSLASFVITFIIVIIIGIGLVSNIIFGMSTIPVQFDSDKYAILDIPVNGFTFPEYGDETWLETTPFLFTEDNKKALEELPYVESVVPMHSPRYEVSSSAYYLQDKGYAYDPTLDMSDINFEQYGVDIKDYNVSNIDITFDRILYSEEVRSVIDPEMELVYGSEPSDQSDEIVIDNVLASYIATLRGYDNLEDLVGEEITVELTELVHEQTPRDFTFTISGITSYQPEILEFGGSYVVLPYNTNSSDITDNEPWLNNDYIRLREKAMAAYDVLGIEPPDVSDSEIGRYETFLVTLKDETYAKELFNTVNDYDKYIYQISNYSAENTNYYQYISKRVNKIIVILILVFIVLLIQMLLLSRSIIGQFKEIRYKLSFYGYTNKAINTLINRKINQFVAGLIMLGILLNIPTLIFIIASDNSKYIKLLIIPLCILIIILTYSLILKKMTRKSNNYGD